MRPRNLRLNGEQAKGYDREELADLCLRYVSKAELRALLEELRPAAEGAPGAAPAPEGSGEGAAN